MKGKKSSSKHWTELALAGAMSVPAGRAVAMRLWLPWVGGTH